MDASDEEITEAATTANVHSFISKLPNEYLTEVLHHFLWKLINTWGRRSSYLTKYGLGF
jgi:hypothetical protein